MFQMTSRIYGTRSEKEIGKKLLEQVVWMKRDWTKRRDRGFHSGKGDVLVLLKMLLIPLVYEQK
jgi:hypothetical protein